MRSFPRPGGCISLKGDSLVGGYHQGSHDEPYQARQTTGFDDGDVKRVRVTSPHHALKDQYFPVVRRVIKRGQAYLIVLLPSGSTQLIREQLTSEAKAPEAPESIFSLASVRALVSMVAELRATQTLVGTTEQEATNDRTSTLRTVDYIQSANTAAIGAAVDRSTSSPSSRTAGASKRRNP